MAGAHRAFFAKLTTLLVVTGLMVGGLLSGDGSAATDPEDADEGVALTLAAAVQRALSTAPSLTLARLDVEEATIALQEAELGQLVGRPPNEYEQAVRSLQEARDAYVDELAQIALAVEEAYHNVLSAFDAVVTQRSNQEQAERQFALTTARFEAGLIPRQDFLEAELSFDQSLRASQTTRRRYENALYALLRLIGLDGETPVVLQDEFAFDPWHIELDAAVEEALSSRAEIARAERAVEQARLHVELADTPYAAPVELHRAEIALERALIQLEQVKNEVETQVRNEWFALSDLRHNIDVASRREELALTRVQISRTKHDAGTISLLQLLQDEEAYAQARHDAVSAVWEYNLAHSRFLRTLGRSELPPLPPAIAEWIDSWNAE